MSEVELSWLVVLLVVFVSFSPIDNFDVIEARFDAMLLAAEVIFVLSSDIASELTSTTCCAARPDEAEVSDNLDQLMLFFISSSCLSRTGIA